MHNIMTMKILTLMLFRMHFGGKIGTPLRRKILKLMLFIMHFVEHIYLSVEPTPCQLHVIRKSFH
jgi:hypothetical protein